MKVALKIIVVSICSFCALILAIGIVEPVVYPTVFFTKYQSEVAARQVFLNRFLIGVFVSISVLVISFLLKLKYFISLLITILIGTVFFYTKICYGIFNHHGCEYKAHFDYMMGVICIFLFFFLLKKIKRLENKEAE